MLILHASLRESPLGDLTSSSEYFATAEKAKPSRSTPAKTAAIDKMTSTTDSKNNHESYHSNISVGQSFKAESTRKDSASKKRSKLSTDTYRDGKELNDLSNSSNRPENLQVRKRKSIEISDNEDKKASILSRRKVNSEKKKPSVKKPTIKKVLQLEPEADVDERSGVQDILDSIPTIRPPTPPSNIGSKTFDFRAAAQRSHVQPSTSYRDTATGAANCLAGLSFVFTGMLESLDRGSGTELIKRYGGKVTTAPSSKTSYVILGSDAGPKKLETIAKFSLKVINENGLYEMIRRLPANGGDGRAAKKLDEKLKQEAKEVESLAAEMERQEKLTQKETVAARKAACDSKGMMPVGKTSDKGVPTIDNRLWTVKYAPTATGMICGNKVQVDKLQAWLRAWPSNAQTKFKKAGKDGYGVFRAVMIHGPPGIGKTTAAHLAAKLEGYDAIESNASDARSKKLVDTGLRGVLDTTSLFGYFTEGGQSVDVGKKKLVLIMDEVDGMSAGDRGGVGALAAVCKKSDIPIILICNERRIPKMKAFDSVTYDLPFRRPTVDQIRSRIMTICFREGLKIPSNVVNALIEGSRADIRQVINMLSTAKLCQNVVDFDQSKRMLRSWEKHIVLKPWDIVSKIIGGGMFAPSSVSTLNDKIELYFNDHEFSSLMLQENYLGSKPLLSNNLSGEKKALKLLELSDCAAESISDGDLVDRMIHGSQQHWSLMPIHAVLSFVRPASFISGSQAGNQTRFTAWLGNNSKYGT